jgi:hypothetical protein
MLIFLSLAEARKFKSAVPQKLPSPLCLAL